MFLADYHTHSLYSSDGQDDFSALLNHAAEAGLSELCVTDHCDMLVEGFPAAERLRDFEEARERNAAGVKLLLGIELGEGIHNIEKAEAAVAACPYDFIIGSHHALKSGKDFYHIGYTSETHCHTLLQQYFTELCEMAEWGCFDVLGHIGYPLRYMMKKGFSLRLLPRYEVELRELFTILIRKGLGIEYNLREVIPFLDILLLYRQCGGETVTIGSDAHCAADVGRNIKEGVELCRTAGFNYIAAFEQRKVRYEKI